MPGDNPQASRSITIRMPIELFEFMREESLKGHRSINRQFGLLIIEAMKTKKAPEHGLENRSDASKAE